MYDKTKFKKIRKNLWTSDRSQMTAFIHVAKGGQLRFSSGFAERFSLKGGEKLDFFRFENQIFIEFSDSGTFEVQVHKRTGKRSGTDYICQSVGLFMDLIEIRPDIKRSFKLLIGDYIDSINCYNIIIFKENPYEQKNTNSP